MGRSKPKENKRGDSSVSNVYDCCYTPSYALDPLLPFLPRGCTIWESACGAGFLVRALERAGHTVIATDLQLGDHYNFMRYAPGESWAVQVTNPPYSIKTEWLARSYALGRPFALLVPVETIALPAYQALAESCGFEWILLDKRVNFHMPNTGYKNSGAQFPVMWLTWGLQIGQPVTFGKITRYDDDQPALFDLAPLIRRPADQPALFPVLG